MIRIPYHTAIQDVKEIVEGREDYIYVNPHGEIAGGDKGLLCYYFSPKTGQPSCIVGHVFARHGITIDDLSWANDNCIIDAADVAGIDIDAETRSFLEAVQERQDSGIPWGEAFKQSVED